MLTIEEALLDLYKGTVNVKKTADELKMPLSELQHLFREYTVKIPVDDNIWQGDVEPSWPWA